MMVRIISWSIALLGIIVFAVLSSDTGKKLFSTQDSSSFSSAKQSLQCDILILSGGVLLDKDCFQLTLIGQEDQFIDLIDRYRDSIIGFTNEYGIHQEAFIYSGAKPIFSGQLNDIAHKISSNDFGTKTGASSSGNKLLFTPEEYDIWRLLNFGYYVTRKDKLDELGPCARTNYDVAMIALDHKVVQPGEEFNVNKRFAHRIGYCGTPDSLSNYSFQGGVCGVSTQLFRTALIHPDIEVLERHPHQIWYERYYDDIIWGDDAAIIEFRKQLRMINTGKYPIYFRTKNFDHATSGLVVAISPYTDKRRIQIQRRQTDTMKGQISVTTYDQSGSVLSHTGWDSEYRYRESGRVN